MKVKLLKDTPDIKAGAIFSTLKYNVCTKDFIDSYYGADYQRHVFYFYDDNYANEWDSFSRDTFQSYLIDLVKSKPDWFEIIEE